ncbi:calponin homology domain-containing protein [Blyttiomyces helicus]|uniref:Calponin homology domain-containing protein n=1 Tax=Blyttiomyces helicus TaxID=388810 RepID=A0A4P9WM99_9FUNG|nr:calponin homology domain-containing protein [Blyttiomyces helicus]|eukprot:RKO93143.1 calponin homology domain-containing protein [Blyttiomyces helicus]
MLENNFVVIDSAKSIGCNVVNIGVTDLLHGSEHLVLDLLWEIINIGLQTNISITARPSYTNWLPADQILLRWVNHYLTKADGPRRVANFGAVLEDGRNYMVLMEQLDPRACCRAPFTVSDIEKRAEKILSNAERLTCQKYLTAETLIGGNQKLNFAFVAHLLNNHPNRDTLTKTEMENLGKVLRSRRSTWRGEEDRQAHVVTLWLNSIGVQPPVNDLFTDLKDSIIPLQALDKLQPGIVDWKVIKPAQTFGNKALVWQLMCWLITYPLEILSKDGAGITSTSLMHWGDATINRAGKLTSICSFKDPQIRDGVFLKEGVVDPELVTAGVTDDDAKSNARYAISITRTLGASVSILPDDIVEVKVSMVRSSPSELLPCLFAISSISL